MVPVLTVFIDGLKPESLIYMPFLNSFMTKRRLRPELGYSIVCCASMYTGVHPDKHLRWFIWKYSPRTSPFRWINRIGIDRSARTLYGKYVLHKMTQAFNNYNTAYFGIPFLVHTPIRLWHYFDVDEKKFWNEPGFIESYPTVFEILTSTKIPYEVVGMGKREVKQSSQIIAQHSFDQIRAWTYLFVGDVDALLHRHGQNSPITIEQLKRIDHTLEKVYDRFKKKLKEFYFICFSDHGHVKVKGRVNLSSLFRQHGKSIENYIHFIDANYARFWFRDEEERKEVSVVLSNLDKGFILTERHLQKYNVTMPDNRYGDLIFYLDAGYIFDKGRVFAMGREWSSSSKTVSMHGYLPDCPDSHGIFISNAKIKQIDQVKLVDILPSILALLGVKSPHYVDGRVLWEED